MNQNLSMHRTVLIPMPPCLALLAVTLTVALGCTTPRFLSKNAIKQGQTVMDIHQQQVLDNLAKFVYDPNSLPSFAHATGGTAEAIDQGQAAGNAVWKAAGFDSFTLGGISGSRQAKSNWTLVPVTEPRKLELMRCAFQKAVANCGRGGPSESCPDCTKRFNAFYTGKPFKTKFVAKPACTESQDPDLKPPCADGTAPYCKLETHPILGNHVISPSDPTSSGAVTSECINPGCCQWFGYGSKDCVPKDCGCIYIGSYCGTYVWVTSSRGRDELAKLTLAILDYAQNSARTLPTKEVTAYLTYDGIPTTEKDANIIIKTEIAAGDVSGSVLKPENDAAIAMDVCRKGLARKGLLDSEALPSPEDQRRQNYIEALPDATPLRSQPTEASPFDWGPSILQFEQQRQLLE